MYENLKYENLDEDLGVEDDFYVAASKRQAHINEGAHSATITNITLEKNVENNYGGVSKITDVYWFEFRINENTVRKRYAKSVHEKSNLYKTIKTLTGNDPRNGYDVRKLIGKDYLVTIVHKQDRFENTWENIDAVMPLPSQFTETGYPLTTVGTKLIKKQWFHAYNDTCDCDALIVDGEDSEQTQITKLEPIDK